MFANKERITTLRKKSGSEENDIKAFLGTGSEFEGRMKFNESMLINGTFRGEISSKDTLVVGATAYLQAEVTVGSLIISGCFHGNIKAKTRVELRAPAHINGNIETPSISVEDGVTFNGTIKMIGAVETKSKDQIAA